MSEESALRELARRADAGDTEARQMLLQLHQQATQQPGQKQSFGQRFMESLPAAAMQAVGIPPSISSQPIPEDTIGPSVGEYAGNVAGIATGPFAPVAVPALGALGAAGGLAAERFIRGKPQPTMGEMGTEALLSFAPEAIEGTIKGVAKGTAKLTKSAKRLFEDKAKGYIEDVAQQTFKAPTKEAAYKAFDDLRAMGIEIQGRNVRKNLGVFTEEGKKDILSNIRLLPKPNREVDIEYFSKMANRIEASMNKKAVRFSLAELQDLRSALMTRARHLSDGAQKDLLYDAAGQVDTAIRNGLDAIGDEGAKEAVQSARRNYFLYTTGEDFGAVLGKSARPSRDGRSFTIHLGRLKEAILNPGSKLEKTLSQKMDDIPGSKERVIAAIDNMIGKTDEIVIEGGLLQNPLGVMGNIPKRTSQLPWMQSIVNAIGGQLADDIGRERLERLVIENGGKVTVNSLAILSNALRRAGTSDRDDKSQAGY